VKYTYSVDIEKTVDIWLENCQQEC